MANREQPYDPYIPAGGASHGGNTAQDGGNQRTAALQAVGGALPSTLSQCAHQCSAKPSHRLGASQTTMSISAQRARLHHTRPDTPLHTSSFSQATMLIHILL